MPPRFAVLSRPVSKATRYRGFMAFDRAYYDRFYFNPRTAVTSKSKPATGPG